MMTSARVRNGEPFDVTVEFLSDWSCGTGNGRHGAVDREIDRDHEGFPLLRGKTMSAMLRDAAETVAAGLDEGADGTWQQWVEAVFGSQRSVADDGGAVSAPTAGPHGGPRPAALQARPLRIPAPARTQIGMLDDRSQELVGEAMVLLRPGVRIDPDTGAAKDEMFRVEEWAAAGLTVQAQWRLTFPTLADGEPVPWEAELLLLAAARMAVAVGGRRRRGGGRCEVRIGGGATDGTERLGYLLDWVDTARAPRDALATTETSSSAEALGRRSADPLRHRYDLRITALTPLQLPRGVAGNTVLTETYVPGTMLLPIVARALGSQATELITGSRVVVTDATIEIGQQRATPLPRALASERGVETSQLVNLLRIPGDDDRRVKADDRYCVPAAGGLRVDEPSLVAGAHAVVDDQAQRPNERSGGMFVYEAIAAGTVLRAQVWLPDGVPLDSKRLDGERAIGRSKKDDYGQVRIEVIDAEQPSVTSAAATSEELVVWLLSDLLLRGEAGEPAADVSRLATVLGQELGVTLTFPDHGTRAGEAPCVLLTGCRRESWQTRWQLPRPSLAGLASGSVVRYAMAGQPAPAAMERVQACGIGERTAEGFGRIALQPSLLTAEFVDIVGDARQAATAVSEVPETGAGVSQAVTELVVQGWRRELYRTAIARARDPQLRAELVPDNATAAQLGTLRTLADRLAAEEEPSPALGWIERTRRARRRRTAWGKGRLDRLQHLFSAGDSQLWELLDVTPPAEVVDDLYWPALSWLLSEVARTESKWRLDNRTRTGPRGDQEMAL